MPRKRVMKRRKVLPPLTGAQQRLVESTQNLVRKLVSVRWHYFQMSKKGYLFDDVLQDCQLKVCRAVRSYRPETGYAWTTYCGSCVVRHLKSLSCTGDSVVRVCPSTAAKLGRDPEAHARRVLAQSTVTWEAAGYEAGREDPGPGRLEVRDLLERLPDQHARFLTLKFGLDGRGPRKLALIYPGVGRETAGERGRALLAEAREILNPGGG